MENGLWGAPRIHGELLKLGFTVSERTVSRYLPDPRMRGSQTWRTFLANHVGNLPFASATSSLATSDDDVHGHILPCRPLVPSRARLCAPGPCPFADWPPSRLTISLGWRVAQTQLRCTHTRFSSGRDPPQSSAVEFVVVAYD